jgi:hypothetical protein
MQVASGSQQPRCAADCGKALSLHPDADAIAAGGAAMTPRLDTLKHAAQARVQVERGAFRMVTGKLKGDAARAVYRVEPGTFDSLVLYRHKLAGLETDSGDLQWAALPKGCGICMSGRSRQGGRG